ncbi:MAG: alpha/beta hydrolase [Algoriphagus sp.]|nr:alpha/beta hydrolase [Algoriphagus sp.]
MKKSLQFSYEASYFLSHEPTGKEQEIWIVLHGYGQLAEFFIRKFIPFSSENRLILAPEGTNHSYLQEFQGRVGANWMTSYNRETSIANNHRFLNRILDELLLQFSSSPRIHLLGFSQGAATGTRWASQWVGFLDSLVLWGGGFAHDLALNLAKEKFASTEILLVYGAQDSLLTEESKQRQEDLVHELGKPLNLLTFDGGHEINPSLLEKIINQRF